MKSKTRTYSWVYYGGGKYRVFRINTEGGKESPKGRDYSEGGNRQNRLHLESRNPC